MDVPQYRYRRIGVPVAAKIISLLQGKLIVSPITFFKTQIFLTCLGFFILLIWLKDYHISGFWAYTWVISSGVITCLRHGLPDPVSDSFLIISLFCIIRKKLFFYLITSLFLSIIREVYIVLPVGVFIFTLLRVIDWKHDISPEPMNNNLSKAWILLFEKYFSSFYLIKSFFRKLRFSIYLIFKRVRDFRVIFLMFIPILFFIAWHLYIYFYIPKAGAADITILKPFEAAIKAIQKSINDRSKDTMLVVSSFLILLSILLISFKNIFRHPVMWVVLGYGIIVSLLGDMVWSDFGAYTKTVSPFLACLVFMLPFEKSFIIRLLLLFNVYSSLGRF